jgi:hypothetical protein
MLESNVIRGLSCCFDVINIQQGGLYCHSLAFDKLIKQWTFVEDYGIGQG